jgi:hypothetical protein
MVSPQVTSEEVVVNTLKVSVIADKRWSQSLGVSEVLTTSQCKEKSSMLQNLLCDLGF